MEPVTEVLIVCSVPIYARGLERMLRDAAPAASFHSIARPEHIPDNLAPDVVVIRPWTWEEMHRWIPHLLPRFAACRWLLCGDLRVDGLFGGRLRKLRCMIVAPDATPEALVEAFMALMEGVELFPVDALRSRFDEGVAPLLGRRRAGPITLRLLAYACGASLRLSTRQMAEILDVAEGTVQDRISDLLHQYHRDHREALGTLVERAFSS